MIMMRNSGITRSVKGYTALLKIRMGVIFVVLAMQSTLSFAGNMEDCLQDQDQALAAIACPLYEAELAAQAAGNSAPPSDAAQVAVADSFDQDWLLNPAKSRLSLTSVKKETIRETHDYTGLEGRVSPTGDASVTIDLELLETNVDIRNVRMRFLFFETFKFPKATISTQLDPDIFRQLAEGAPISYLLTAEIDLHGITKTFEIDTVVIRTSENSVLVAAAGPVTIEVSDFDLSEGLARLSAAIGGISIVPNASVDFELVFEGAAFNPDLEQDRAALAARQADNRVRALTDLECQNRMDVISETRQIYFRSGSANIDSAESAPVLDEVANFFNRCASVQMEISGHTDTDGSASYNLGLSQRRAAAVAEELRSRGISGTRVAIIGYGFSQPVAGNDTSAGKAKNRRIEFRRIRTE